MNLYFIQVSTERDKEAPALEQTNQEGRKSRKRVRDPSKWKSNVRKRLRQSGMAYTDSKGNAQPERKVKITKDCGGNCKYKCTLNIGHEDRDKIFRGFWSLSEIEKAHFYGKTTLRCVKMRKRTKAQESRRKFSLKYFLFVDDRKVRVCKEFYLTTLDISQRRISYYHDHKDKSTGLPKSDARGKHIKKCVPEAKKEFVREHIRSFPRVESHYCRSKTKKEYLESTLTLQKMYAMYTEACEDAPVKLSMYRHIFNTEFNIEFQKPKKDRCDLCEEQRTYETNGEAMGSDFKTKYEAHVARKFETKEERHKDRSGNETVICIDLQNVIALPRANISCFFYRRKLNVYNLTAHCKHNLQKEGYCCIWDESQAGRTGNDMASAAVAILAKVLQKHPDISKMIIWSDSCIPQNKNSYMSLAILKFMENNPQILSIEQKFCEPGHSSIQEVDSLHSQIEKVLRFSEVYSPLGFVRLLLKVNEKNPLQVIHLQTDRVKNYLAASKSLSFSGVPYSKVKQISYSRSNLLEVEYKTHFTGPSKRVKLIPRKARIRGKDAEEIAPIPSLPEIKKYNKVLPLSVEKQKDLLSMFKFMPKNDREYMKTLCHSK